MVSLYSSKESPKFAALFKNSPIYEESSYKVKEKERFPNKVIY